MEFISSIPGFLVTEILAVPAFLIGIITAIGLAAMQKSSGQVIGGAIKATLGFLLIGAGANLVVAALEPLGVMIVGATGAQGVVPTKIYADRRFLPRCKNIHNTTAYSKLTMVINCIY